MTKQLQAEVEVQASAERVWEVLTDFATYPQWNPFIVKASGEPVPGAGVRVGGHSLRTNERGQASLKLRAGTYRVVASKTKYVSADTSVRVKAVGSS